MTQLLFEYHPNGLYFGEFCKLCTEVTSELYMVIFDQIYQHVPLVKTFFMMRSNFISYLASQNIQFPAPNLLVLMPPITNKMVDRVIEHHFTSRIRRQSLTKQDLGINILQHSR